MSSAAKPTAAAITDALLAIVAERGMSHATVREVAAAAGVSIGTVQHYYPTKDVMLSAAFAEVVQRVRTRLESTRLGPDVRQNLSTVLREILPLDERRRVEARIQVAFAARAATSQALADIQRTVLGEVHEALSAAFALALDRDVPVERCRLAAHAALAVADGLAMHAVSTRRWLTASALNSTLELVLDGLTAHR